MQILTLKQYSTFTKNFFCRHWQQQWLYRRFNIDIHSLFIHLYTILKSKSFFIFLFINIILYFLSYSIS